MRFVCALILGLATLPVVAQVNEQLEMLKILYHNCQNDVGSACVRYRLLKDRNPELAAQVEASPEPALPVTVVPSSEAGSGTGDGWPIWLWVIVVYIPLRLLWGIIKAYRNLPPPEVKQPAPRPTPLERPTIRPGPRSAQGSLILDHFDTQQIVPWDTSRVMGWLEEEEKRLRPLVKDSKILELADKGETVVIPDMGLRFELSEYMFNSASEGRHGSEITNDTRFAQTFAARRGSTSSGYGLGTLAWQEEWTKDRRMVYDLLRLSADMDFNPAAVNMQAYINAYYDQTTDWYDRDVAEAYLRHFFDLGAPDGHYHMADAVATFYLWNATNRDDHGYLAAALDRIKSYDRMEYRRMIERYETMKQDRNLDDQSIDREGFMPAMQRKEQGSVH